MPINGELKRKEITYLDGINSIVGDNIAKPQELLEGENVRSVVIGHLEKRKGYKRLGEALSSPTTYGMAYFNDTNALSSKFYRVTNVGSTKSIYYLNTSAGWTALGGGGTGLTSTNNHFFAVANGYLFMVNGTDDNRYVDTDGTTVVVASTAAITNNLYNSPVARKIAYYKDRLYLGDITISGIRHQTKVMFSSYPVGIVSLIDADSTAPVGGAVLTVTDTKYIYAADTLLVYRGGSLVATITVTAKTESTITTGTITFQAGFTDILAADELWVSGTYTGKKVFRWANNLQGGVDVKQYDTFNLSGAEDEPLTIFDTVGDVLVIGTKNTLGFWNDYSLSMYDNGIGCVSENGYVKTKGMMFFGDYDGIYAVSGASAPKLLTSKVQKYYDGATKASLENGAMGKKGFSIFHSIGNVTLYNDDGSVKKTLSDVVIEYNLQQQNCFVHTGIKADNFKTYKSTASADRLMFSDSSTGHIYEFLYNTTYDDAVTTNREIPMQITLNHQTLSTNFENICYPISLSVEVKTGTAINCFISMDGGRYIPIGGSIKKGFNFITIDKEDSDNPTFRGRTVSLSFRENSGRAIKIGRIAILYVETSEKEKNIN